MPTKPLTYADLFTAPPGAMNYQIATNLGAANALNAQGYKKITYTPGATDGEGTWLMGMEGATPGSVQANLLNYAMGQYNEGRAAQERQYADVMSTIDTLGGTQREQIARQYAAMGGQMQQNAISRGLDNSSVLMNMQRGLASDQAFAQAALQEQLQRQRLDYMASRTIDMPSLDYLGALALQAVQGGQQGTTPVGATPNAVGVANIVRTGSG